MKLLILVVFINFDWATNSEIASPDPTDCLPFMQSASNELRNCLGRNTEFDVSIIARKFNETFMLKTADFEIQKQLVQDGCDFVQMIIECAKGYRDSVPTTCIDPHLLAAELLHEEFQVKMHKYFCMNNLEKALAVVENGGVRDFFTSQFLPECMVPAGDTSLFILENDRRGRNPDFCTNSQKAYDCMHNKFVTARNRNINIVLSETYGIAREIMNCDNEL